MGSTLRFHGSDKRMDRKNGLRSTLIAALRYQKHAIQARPTIYQTVSPRARVNRGEKKGRAHLDEPCKAKHTDS